MNDEQGWTNHRSSFIVHRSLVMTQSEQLTEAVLRGSYRALAQAVSLVEREDPQAERLLAEIYAATGRGRIIGITGSPGAGKSTLLAALARHHPNQQKRGGITPGHPNPPFTAGPNLRDHHRI